MADLISAADTIKRLAFHFQGILAVADALDSIGKIDQATAEVTAQRDAAIQQRDEAQAGLDRSIADIDAAKAKAAGIIDDAASVADGLTNAAASKAADIVAAANDKAQAIIVQASAAAAAQVEQNQAALDRIQSSNTSLSAALVANRADLADVAAQAEEAEARLAAAQAAIQKLLGK